MRRVAGIILVVALLSLWIGPVSALGTPYLGVVECQTPDEYRVMVRNWGDAPGHYAYALPWSVGEEPILHDIGILPPGGDYLTLHIPKEYDGISFFIWMEATQMWGNTLMWRALRPDWVQWCDSTVMPVPLEPERLIAGPDQFMPIGPDDTIVLFVEDTPLYWYPAAWAATPYEVRAGQTAWMIGWTGDYAQIVWASDLVWVPLAVIRP